MTAEDCPSIEKDDDFPVGMRVLAVDDDPTCLKLLESLLHLCQYHGRSSFRLFSCISRALAIILIF